MNIVIAVAACALSVALTAGAVRWQRRRAEQVDAARAVADYETNTWGPASWNSGPMPDVEVEMTAIDSATAEYRFRPFGGPIRLLTPDEADALGRAYVDDLLGHDHMPRLGIDIPQRVDTTTPGTVHGIRPHRVHGTEDEFLEAQARVTPDPFKDYGYAITTHEAGCEFAARFDLPAVRHGDTCPGCGGVTHRYPRR